MGVENNDKNKEFGADS